MQVNSSTRAYAIFRALLGDDHTYERDELLRSGVSERRITGLYPHDLANLNDGLRAYMRAGGRITIHNSVALQHSITDQAGPLYFLLPFAAICEHGEGFDDRWEAVDATAQAIADYPAATFTKVEGNTMFNGPHKQQGVSLIARLSVGLLYAQQLPDTPEAAAYLGSLVDTYLPDLLAATYARDEA